MDEQISALIELAKVSPTVFIAIIAWKVWREMKDIALAFLRGQEQIKRAIIVSNPETARIFDEDTLRKA